MENKIHLRFVAEDLDYDLDYDQPNLTALVQFIIQRSVAVNRENLEISCCIDGFDHNEFREILIEVHEEFQEEIRKFYSNIEKEIKTYYDDETLSDAIIERIKADSADIKE